MKKTILIINLFAFFLSLNSIGQTKSKDVDILWGPELKASKKSTLSDIVGYDETGIYAIKTKRKGLYGLNSTVTLEHYDKEMSQSKSVEIELEEQKKSRTSFTKFLLFVFLFKLFCVLCSFEFNLTTKAKRLLCCVLYV